MVFVKHADDPIHAPSVTISQDRVHKRVFEKGGASHPEDRGQRPAKGEPCRDRPYKFSEQPP
jgi:hypothetical protein